MVFLMYSTIVGLLMVALAQLGLLKRLSSVAVSFFCYLSVMVFIVMSFTHAIRRSAQKAR